MMKNIKIVRGASRCSKTTLSIDEKMPEHCASMLVVAITTESVVMRRLDRGLCRYETRLRSGIGYLIERVTTACTLRLIGLLQDVNNWIEYAHSGLRMRRRRRLRAQRLRYCDEVRRAFGVVS